MGKSCGSFSGAAESEKTAILFGGGGHESGGRYTRAGVHLLGSSSEHYLGR